MNKYLLDDNGTPIVDDDGKKILNPDWIAANKSYTLAADEVDQTGALGGSTYEPDAAAQAWHDEQVSGLKKAQSKALSSMAKQRTRAEAAEAEVARLTAENETLRKSGGTSDEDVQARIDSEVKSRVRTIEGERDEARTENATLKSELSKFRYEGRIESAMIGVVDPTQKFVAMNTLKALIKEDDKGKVTCYDQQGEIVVDNAGEPVSVEDFIKEDFRRSFGSLCVKDTSVTTNGTTDTIPKSNGNNPFAKETMNRTVQHQMLKNDKAKAVKMMKQAGWDQSKINRMANQY
ncbi:MAG: hypothetical protein ABJH52_07275 [Henriciella sp.]